MIERFRLPARLTIPDPTKTPSHPSCIIRAASAGVAIPPAANLRGRGGRQRVAVCRGSKGRLGGCLHDDGQPLEPGSLLQEVVRRLNVLQARHPGLSGFERRDKAQASRPTLA